jgi:hypothetical protein
MGQFTKFVLGMTSKSSSIEESEDCFGCDFIRKCIPGEAAAASLGW